MSWEGRFFRQQVADASSLLNVFVTNDSSHPVPAREQNTDANGNIKVHEQGTANVSVTNSSLPVALSPVSGGGNAATVQAGDSATYSPPVVASGLTMLLTGEIDEVIFFYQNSPVAFITGPSGTSLSSAPSTVYMPLTRPI